MFALLYNVNPVLIKLPLTRVWVNGQVVTLWVSTVGTQ